MPTDPTPTVIVTLPRAIVDDVREARARNGSCGVCVVETHALADAVIASLATAADASDDDMGRVVETLGRCMFLHGPRWESYKRAAIADLTARLASLRERAERAERDNADTFDKWHTKARVYGAIAARYQQALRQIGHPEARAAEAWRHSESCGVPRAAIDEIDALLSAESERDSALARAAAAERERDEAREALRRHQAEPDQSDPDGWIRRSALNEWAARASSFEAKLARVADVLARGPRYTDRHMEAAADAVIEEVRCAVR